MRPLISLSLLLALTLWVAAEDKPETKKPKRNFTIGKDTTRVDGPLDKDGYVDYAAALNERMGKGVTAENNANVLIWKALGPRPEGGKGMPEEFFKLLKIDAPPEKGDYFIDITKYARETLMIPPADALEPLFDSQSRASKRPWKAGDHPDIASWLKVNEKPLAVFHEAAKRTHYFSPLVPSRTEKGSSGLLSSLLPTMQKCRGVAPALTARAMLHVGEGRPDEAWADLLACHRLARHVGRGGTLIEALVGIAIDQIVSQAEIAFLAHAKLDAKQLRACLRELQQLPPISSVADKIDLTERFTYLDNVMLTAKHGLPFLEAMADGLMKKPNAQEEAFMRAVNWDPALRIGNQWFDRIVAAGRVADRAEREKQFDQIVADLKGLKKQFQDWVPEAAASAEGRGKAIGNIMIGLLLPAIHKVTAAADRGEQTQRNQQVAFALAIFKSERGGYPKTLEALTPDYLAKVPDDLFSGKPLIYRWNATGYLLYSVGPNGKDDGGRWYDDEPKGDDPNVRMPLPKLKVK